MAAAVYIPIFVQGIYAGTMLGSVVTAQAGGFLATKMSYRNIMFLSGVILIIGFLLLSGISPETSRALLTVFMIVIGLGVGFSFLVLSMVAIHPFGMEQRGSATSTSNFIRSLGMTFGITVFGTIQRSDLNDGLKDAFSGMGQMKGQPFGDSLSLLSEGARSHIRS